MENRIVKRVTEKRKGKWKLWIMAVLAMAIAFCGIFLPGRILKWQSNLENDTVKAVPQEYYSAASSATARNASLNLKTIERLQLITGQWESTTQQISAYEMEIEDYEAVELAKTAIAELYAQQYYPEEIRTAYGNWYTWKAVPFKAVDTTFGIYTAYYWKIDFCKYDESAKHTVYKLEDGTVFYAQMEQKDSINGDAIANVFQRQALQSVYVVETISTENLLVEEQVPYTSLVGQDLQWKSYMKLTSEEDVYQILQAYSKDSYVWCVMPEKQ